MGLVRDTADQLYESDSLVGFVIASDSGDILHNESFFSDEAAQYAITSLISSVDQLALSDRHVKRLTIELDDLLIIFTHITDQDQRGMFLISKSCDLDQAAKTLEVLAA